MSKLVFLVLLTLAPTITQAKPLLLHGNVVYALCTPLLGQDHICRYYDDKGRLVKQTRDWRLDLLAQKILRTSNDQQKFR
jgi:hypothetical protein